MLLLGCGSFQEKLFKKRFIYFLVTFVKMNNYTTYSGHCMAWIDELKCLVAIFCQQSGTVVGG